MRFRHSCARNLLAAGSRIGLEEHNRLVAELPQLQVSLASQLVREQQPPSPKLDVNDVCLKKNQRIISENGTHVQRYLVKLRTSNQISRNPKLLRHRAYSLPRSPSRLASTMQLRSVELSACTARSGHVSQGKPFAFDSLARSQALSP